MAALETVAICGDRDGVVLAFLRHSKFDVRKAKESMRRCCAWRRENEVRSCCRIYNSSQSLFLFPVVGGGEGGILFVSASAISPSLERLLSPS